MTMELEDEFDICIPDEALNEATLTTVGDVVKYVEKRLAESSE